MAKRVERNIVTGNDLFSLGMTYQTFLNTLSTMQASRNVFANFTQLMDELENCDIDYPAGSLLTQHKLLSEFAAKSPNQRVPTEATGTLLDTFGPIEELLINQIRRLEVCAPPRHHVFDALKTLKLKGEQKLMAEEIGKCLTVGAFPASVVMSWCLTLDFIRGWIFTKHLAAFNARITAAPYNQTAVAQQEDFFLIPESKILRAAHDAGLWHRNKQTILLHSLEERNLFAHPSHTASDFTHAAAYFEKLCREVLMNKHFKGK